MKKLYRFYVDFYRKGELEGVFVATPGEIQEACGKKANFGEVLGKHSDVYFTVDQTHFKELSVSEQFIEEFPQVFPNGVGHNPLNCLVCPECGGFIPDGECCCHDFED